MGSDVSQKAVNGFVVLVAVDLVQVVPPLEQEGLRDQSKPGGDGDALLATLRLGDDLPQLLLGHVLG